MTCRILRISYETAAMDKEWMRGMLPDKPPKGYQDWILRAAADDLDMDFMLYSAERANVYPELKAIMCQEDLDPIKSIWQTRCTCTVCGEDFVTRHIKNGFAMYSGPDGNLYELDPVNYEPEAYDDIEDCGFDSQIIEISDYDGMVCPVCLRHVHVLHRSKLRGGRIKQALGCTVQNIANYTAIIFWLTAKRIDEDGCISVETYPRDAYVIGDQGGIMRYRKTFGSAGCFSSERRENSWRIVSDATVDSATILYHSWGCINNRAVGCYTWNCVPDLGGCTGEKTGLDAYIRQGGNYPVTYLKIWRKHRTVENLVKAGWGQLVERNIARYTDNDPRVLSTDVEGIDFTKAKPHEMLRMTKADFRAVTQKAVWWPDKFEAWVEYREIGGACSAPVFGAYFGDFGDNGMTALMDLLRVDQTADIPKVANYLAKQNISPTETRLLVDAREMAEALHPERELTDEERWPKHLMAVHDRLDQLTRLSGDPRKNLSMEKGFRAVIETYGCLEWGDGEFRVLLPRSNAELVQEGNVLRHCVGGYGESHCKGRLIFFVRKYRRPERSYYTLNIDMTQGKPKEIQLHGYGNEHHGQKKEYRHKIPKKVRDFVDRWEKEVLLPWWLAQIHNDKKERSA